MDVTCEVLGEEVHELDLAAALGFNPGRRRALDRSNPINGGENLQNPLKEGRCSPPLRPGDHNSLPARDEPGGKNASDARFAASPVGFKHGRRRSRPERREFRESLDLVLRETGFEERFGNGFDTWRPFD